MDRPSTQGWRNWLLVVAGAGGVLAPDLSSLDVLLGRHSLSWVLNLVHLLGSVALLAASWSRVRTWLPKSRLWNRVLLLAGLANVVAPDLTGLADWLSSSHVGWLTHAAHGLGGAALLATTWSKIAGKIAEHLPEDELVLATSSPPRPEKNQASLESQP